MNGMTTDNASELPPEMKNFPVWWLAKFWQTTTQHIFNLIQSGALPYPLDLRNKGSSRAMIRIPRPSVEKFICERKDLQAVADSNPSPKPRAKPQRRSLTNHVYESTG